MAVEVAGFYPVEVDGREGRDWLKAQRNAANAALTLLMAIETAGGLPIHEDYRPTQVEIADAHRVFAQWRQVIMRALPDEFDRPDVTVLVGSDEINGWRALGW